ncbi:MAG: hypothetical protein KY475_11960 [Planctomycetes bacterium]|nr:hypothetical protein [Planctomycetota bacterium]
MTKASEQLRRLTWQVRDYELQLRELRHNSAIIARASKDFLDSGHARWTATEQGLVELRELSAALVEQARIHHGCLLALESRIDDVHARLERVESVLTAVLKAAGWADHSP